MHGRAANCAKDHASVTRLDPRTGSEESQIHATFTEEWQRISLSRHACISRHPKLIYHVSKGREEEEEEAFTRIIYPYSSFAFETILFLVSSRCNISLAPQSRSNRISNEQTMNSDERDSQCGSMSWRRNARNRQRAAFVSQCLP